MRHESLPTVISTLRALFTVVLGLSLGEAYKQVVADRVDDDTGKAAIRWDSLWSLVAFLSLFFPFVQGMNVFLDTTYDPKVVSPTYGRSLLFDVGAFTIEASFFFVMSRALRRTQWRRFYGAVLAILLTDTVWGAVNVELRHQDFVRLWLASNVVFVVMIGLFVWHCWKETDGKDASRLGCAIMILRAWVDYASSWSQYFPSP